MEPTKKLPWWLTCTEATPNKVVTKIHWLYVWYLRAVLVWREVKKASGLELFNYFIQVFYIRLAKSFDIRPDGTPFNHWFILYWIVPFSGWSTPFRFPRGGTYHQKKIDLTAIGLYTVFVGLVIALVGVLQWLSI